MSPLVFIRHSAVDDICVGARPFVIDQLRHSELTQYLCYRS